MKAKYDNIGINYAKQRQSDPRIAAQIFDKLKEATKIVNIGAGAGSYEPKSIDLIALEPSIEMINQRAHNAHPVIQGYAESLPFPDNSFSHALTILSMHHWSDRKKAFQEINRVTTEKFVAVSWNPDADPFWLTRDYFPEVYDLDKTIFPNLEELNDHFDDVKMVPLLIPEDCIDGFLAAYWKRPLAYLEHHVRNSISSFSKFDNLEDRLKRLNADVQNGTWNGESGNGTILYAEGDFYIGEWRENIKEGWGNFSYSGGAVYVGQYENGLKHGNGTWVTYCRCSILLTYCTYTILNGPGTFGTMALNFRDNTKITK